VFWLQSGTGIAAASLWFVGEAGKTYVVDYKPDRYSYSLSIQDEASGATVGGRSGSSDEPSAGDAAKSTP
jgi:hypothetical protein